MEPKQPRARRWFTPAFKAEIVELCQQGDRSIGQVARDFDLTETAVREWVRQAERDSGNRSDGGLTSAERHELAALRRENLEEVGVDVAPLAVLLDPLGHGHAQVGHGGAGVGDAEFAVLD